MLRHSVTSQQENEKSTCYLASPAWIYALRSLKKRQADRFGTSKRILENFNLPFLLSCNH